MKTNLTMKKGLVMLFSLIGMIACDDNGDDVNPNTQAQISEVKSIAAEGEWQVTYFWDSDKDETASFNGYSFSFEANGSLIAIKSATTVTGQWSITGDDDDDDDDSDDDFDDVDFNIAFSTPADFEELTEDWHIISISNTKIELTHVSGGNGGTDFLTFERN
jgi:hypothetical protein